MGFWKQAGHSACSASCGKGDFTPVLRAPHPQAPFWMDLPRFYILDRGSVLDPVSGTSLELGPEPCLPLLPSFSLQVSGAPFSSAFPVSRERSWRTRAVPRVPNPRPPLNPAMGPRAPHTGRLVSGLPVADPVALAPSTASCSADRSSETVAPRYLQSVVPICPGPTSPSLVSCTSVATGRLAPPGASALCAVVAVKGAGRFGALETTVMK